GAISTGPPAARKTHGGKYEESTSSRLRGGSGLATPLPAYCGPFLIPPALRMVLIRPTEIAGFNSLL
ncbi:MAG: hypothetical protein ABGZ23_29665, partial [Fuerstiella sp.]